MAQARAHNPLLKEKIKCIGGCRKKFDAPSSMLLHLESDHCRSRITAAMLDKVIIENDPLGVVTDLDAVLARQAMAMSLTSDDSSSDSEHNFTPDESSDSELNFALDDSSDGTITPTGYAHSPTSTASSSTFGGVLLTPSSSSLSTTDSESGILTPSSPVGHPFLLPNGRYECPLCPAGSRRTFKSLETLQNHMVSPIAHLPKIYHCPDPAFLGVESSPDSKAKKKNFARLSGLVQHVEYGACEGGRAMFSGMVEFVNEKLSEVGKGEMRMISA